MSKGDDYLDFPTKGVSKGSDLALVESIEVYPIKRESEGGLTEAQVDRLIDGRVKVAEGLVDIGREIVSIVRLREEGKKEVALIEARTDAVVKQMRAGVDVIVAQGGRTEKRGKQTVAIIRELGAIIGRIPDVDAASRQAAIALLPDLVSKALEEKDEPVVVAVEAKDE